MDTQHLTAFIAVAQQQSFSLAAEQLHLTQPAVSKRVANLESQLGQPLFDRIGHTIQLTEAGRVLLPQALNIQDAVQQAQRSLIELDGEVSGPLRLATSHHLGLHRLPPILRSFSSQYPKVDLQLSFFGSEEAQRAIVSGEAELAIVTLGPDYLTEHSAIYAEALWEDPLEFVTGHGHPLSDQNTITLEDLSCHAAVLPQTSTYTTQIVQQLFDQANQPLHIRLATNFLETIKMLVSIDFGWSVLPATLIDEQVVRFSIKKIRLTRTLGFIHHRQRRLSNAANAFINQLKGC